MRHAFALALLAPSLLFSDTPSVAVDAGTKVTKTYENVLKVELQSISIQFGDEEQEVPDEQLPEIVIEDNELMLPALSATDAASHRATSHSRSRMTSRYVTASAQLTAASSRSATSAAAAAPAATASCHADLALVHSCAKASRLRSIV